MQHDSEDEEEEGNIEAELAHAIAKDKNFHTEQEDLKAAIVASA